MIPILDRSIFLTTLLLATGPQVSAFEGKWVAGEGNVKSLKLIDQAFDSMTVSSDMASLSLFYKRDWDGLILSNTAWPGWWIQNTYGPSYGMVPFLEEPYATWQENAQALWFRMMGDGKTKDTNGYLGPDGNLCDCTLIFRGGGRDLGFGHFGWPHSTNPVNDGKITMSMTYYRQGDAGHDSNDWCIGFSAAGLLMECERLLVSRNPEDVKQRLPQLKRVAAHLDTRRDPDTNLLKGGKGSNLMAPGFDGWTGADGKKQWVYLTELSVTYCAALMRLAEVCDLTGLKADAQAYRTTTEKVRTALPTLMDDHGSFVMFKDPEGVKHGVYGAAKYGYYETAPNHDAVCMRVVDDAASKKIIDRMVSIKELAPHDLIITNYPASDEPGYPTGGLMTYGTWVHGGHWSTCQGRMNIACLRANVFDHPFKSWDRMCKLMQNFRADAPMGEFGKSPWGGQLGAPHNTVLDCWGVPGGLVRGLFEYDYRADCLRVRPHLPQDITRYVQKKAVVYGKTKVYLTVTGTGKANSAMANGQTCRIDPDGWIELKTPASESPLAVEVICGDAKAQGAWKPSKKAPLVIPNNRAFWELPDTLQNNYHVDLKTLNDFYQKMFQAGLDETYEAAMARTALELMLARDERHRMRLAGTLPTPDIAPIPSCNQEAVEDLYVTNALNIAGGLTDRLEGLTIWENSKPNPTAVMIAKQVKLFPAKRTALDLAPMLIPRNAHPIKVGIAQDGSGKMQGEIGRVSIFNKAMTAGEIATLAATRESMKPGDPVCLYSGIPAIGSSLPVKGNSLIAKQLTFEAWVKPSGQGRILDKITPGGGDGFLIDLIGTNQVRMIIGSKCGGQEKDQPSSIPLNAWAHVAAVLSQESANAIIYINGRMAYDLTGLPVQTLY